MLKDSYHIVTDEVKYLEGNISKELYSDVVDICPIFHEGKNTSFNYNRTFLLQIHDPKTSSETFEKLIHSLPINCRCKISKYVNTQSLGDSSFTEPIEIRAYEFRIIKSVEIVDSTTLRLQNSTWDLSLFKLPKVSKLLLNNCFIEPQRSYKVKFPNLSDLYIDRGIHHVFESIELPENVSLFGISSENAVIENLKSTNLQDLRIDFNSELSLIGNCDFPNLNQFVISDSNIGQLNKFRACSLKTISINSRHSTILWNDLHLPNLETLKIIASEISFEFSDVYCPNLIEATIYAYNQPNPEESLSTPFRFLEKLKSLTIWGGCVQILEGLKLENLESFLIDGRVQYELSQDVYFPKLSSLVLWGTSKTLLKIPKLNAPNIFKIELRGDIINLERSDLHCYPMGISLEVRIQHGVEIDAIDVSCLKRLSISYDESRELLQPTLNFKESLNSLELFRFSPILETNPKCAKSEYSSAFCNIQLLLGDDLESLQAWAYGKPVCTRVLSISKLLKMSTARNGLHSRTSDMLMPLDMGNENSGDLFCLRGVSALYFGTTFNPGHYMYEDADALFAKDPDLVKILSDHDAEMFRDFTSDQQGSMGFFGTASLSN
ncbi:unnamed protein product [Wickerhamomyces anomalus]